MTKFCSNQNSRRVLEAILNRPQGSDIEAIVFEKGDYYCMHMSLPDVKPETIDVHCSHRYITIQGKCVHDNSTFKHVVRLPNLVKKENVYAAYDKGTLDLRFQKDI